MGLARNRPREQSLSSARRPVKQDSFRSLDAQSLEQLRMPQRKLNHLPDLLDYRPQPADVLITDLRNSADRFLDLLTDKNLGPLGDDHSLRRRTSIRHN